MSAETVFHAISTNPVLQQRLAKLLVSQCVRASQLEDLHAGKGPSSKTGDYTDVVVTSPYGDIPWPSLSRLSDAEMKSLMIDIVDRTYLWLHMLFGAAGGELVALLSQSDPVPEWNVPKLRRPQVPKRRPRKKEAT